MATVLIVEDEPLIALGLRLAIKRATGADVLVAQSVRNAERLLSGNLEFALLDINVGCETTYELARKLGRKGVPFAFASGSSQDTLPEDLRGAVFLAKPCRSQVVINTVRKALAASQRRARSKGRSVTLSQRHLSRRKATHSSGSHQRHLDGANEAFGPELARDLRVGQPVDD